MQWKITLPAVLILLVVLGLECGAHVPYLEHQDYTEEAPFVVRRSIEQSIAVYAWLENDGIHACEDIDVYRFEISEPARVYIEGIVPVCRQYEEFVPWFALAGPGLPQPQQEVPFDIPEGYGAVVVENVAPGEERETFYEPFGGKSYYKSPVFDRVMNQSGTYYVYYWDPYERGGDYVAVLGRQEIFRFWDIVRALIYTPMIRLDMELHVDCEPPVMALRACRALWFDPNPFERWG
ncbi:MAG TPA: hypothetical protein ENN54_00220 [Thermoplasmatales archaeon]|nr:hypothetical protein [Candidatus Thermoplasmatota archaeon]MDD5778389.1 hypothetical protein [Candidatus Thermoplasmatota archaeon]HDS58711.1 hypothetical protein [Thermoplasmatales archaeon]